MWIKTADLKKQEFDAQALTAPEALNRYGRVVLRGFITGIGLSAIFVTLVLKGFMASVGVAVAFGVVKWLTRNA